MIILYPSEMATEEEVVHRSLMKPSLLGDGSTSERQQATTWGKKLAL